MLNSNNFLNFEGEFHNVNPEVIAIDKGPLVWNYIPPISILLLSGCSANLGIDPYTVEVFNFTEPSVIGRPPTWNPETLVLTLYRAEEIDEEITDFTFNYRFKDKLGNYSNTATVNVNLVFREGIWKVYPPSYACVTNVFNQKTGYVSYSQLQYFYADDDTPVLPIILKANTPGDPDYIGPQFNSGLCTPDVENLTQIFVNNMFATPDLIVTKLILEYAESVTEEYPISVQPGETIPVYVPYGEGLDVRVQVQRSSTDILYDAEYYEGSDWTTPTDTVIGSDLDEVEFSSVNITSGEISQIVIKPNP